MGHRQQFSAAAVHNPGGAHVVLFDADICRYLDSDLQTHLELHGDKSYSREQVTALDYFNNKGVVNQQADHATDLTPPHYKESRQAR